MAPFIKLFSSSQQVNVIALNSIFSILGLIHFGQVFFPFLSQPHCLANQE